MDKRLWKILLVDDDEDDYLITREMLAETHGAQVQLEWADTYENGRELLRTGVYDAVLMDYDLGIHTGLDLIREAAGSGRPYPLILLTGRGSYEVDVEAMQAGATMYLTKTEMNPLLLERVIRYAIEMKQKESSLVDRETHLEQASERLTQELAERQRTEAALSAVNASLRASQAQLRENERWLRLAYDAADLGTWRYDLLNQTLIFDQRAQAHHGIDQSVVLFDEMMAQVHPDDVANLRQAVADSEGPDSIGRYAAEYRLIHPDGSLHYLSIQARVYFNGEGPERHPVVSVGTCQDITDKREAEARLIRQSERQALLLEITGEILTGGPDLADLTRRVFDKISPHLDADVCFNYQAESEHGPLHLVAGFGIPPEFWDASQTLEFNQAFCGTVAATRQPIVADEQRIQTDVRGQFVRAMGVRAYACHPLFSRSGRVLGTLSLCSTRRSSFSAEEVDFLQTLCHFVALAWDRSGVEEAMLNGE